LKARGHPVGASGLAQVVDVSRRLAGQSASKREFRRGLAQSTGGLATNNFVTILERADAPLVQNLWQPALATSKDQKKTLVQTPENAEGTIETFTIVHVTPDGFLAPLALALIRLRNGRLTMAQGEDDTQLKIGQEVYVRQVDGVYLFTVKSQLQKVQEAFARLWRRRSATDTGVDNRPGGTP
jgi:hypothetical protein